MLATATLLATIVLCCYASEEPLFKATVQMADDPPHFLSAFAKKATYGEATSYEPYGAPPCSPSTSCPVTLGTDIDGAATLVLELLKPVPPACLAANIDNYRDDAIASATSSTGSACPPGTQLISNFCKCPKNKYGEEPEPCSEDPDNKCLETGITDELDGTKQLFTVFPSDCLACKCAPTSNYNAVGMPDVYPTSCNGDGGMGLAVSFKLEGPNAGSIKYSPEVARWKPGSPAGTKVTITFTTTEAFGATDLTMLRIGKATSLTARNGLGGGVADFTDIAFVGPARSTGTQQCRHASGGHTMTFDGKYWHYYDGKTRNFTRTTRYKSTTRDFVIQDQVRGYPARTCALAAREGNDRVIISLCDGAGVIVETDFQTTKVSDQPRIEIKESENQDHKIYTVYFKSGAWMRAQFAYPYNDYLRMNTYFESVDPHASAGMCGNYNNNPNDDTDVYAMHNYDELKEIQKVSSKAYPTDTPCKDGPNSGLSPSCDIWEYTPPLPLPPLPPPPPLLSDPLVVTCPAGSFILPHSESPSGFAECRWCDPGVTFLQEPATDTSAKCRAVSPPCDPETHFEELAPSVSSDRRCTTVTTTSMTRTTTTVSSTTTTVSSTTSTVRRTSTATTTATTSPTTISMAGSLDTSGADPSSSSGMVAGVVVSLLVVGAAGGAFVLCRRRNAAAARAAVLGEIQQEEDRRNTHQMEENPMLAAKRRANAMTVTNPSFAGPSSASVARPTCTDYEYAQGGSQDTERTAGIGGDGSDSSSGGNSDGSSGGNSDGMDVYDQIYAIYDPGASAHVKSYLRGEISRNTAEADLADKSVGTFLIRKKTGSGNFVISVVVKAGEGADSDVQYRHDMIMVERVTAAVYGEVVTAQQYRFKMNGQVVGNPPATTLSSVVAHLAVNASMLGVQLINHGLTLPRSNDGHDVYEYGGAAPLGKGDVDTNAEYEMPAPSDDAYLRSVSVGAAGTGTMPDATPGGITHVYTAVAGDQVVACRYGCGFSCKLGDGMTIKAHEGTCVSFYTTPDGARGGSAV